MKRGLKPEHGQVGVLEHLGIAQAPAWLFAAELREGTVARILTAFERTVPILALRPASRRLSTKVRIFIEHLEKTFVLCSQFNPRTS
jgi:LysR family transcriptional regulator for bpeEF and oprC